MTKHDITNSMISIFPMLTLVPMTGNKGVYTINMSK